MIKLNNKNITYVALADSNNSIKAPKEIWYADSSNSVKLVYRRKDALIEGVDYEKYHWLDGDGTAYIDTLITIPYEIISVKTKIINTSNDYDESIAQNYNSLPFSNRNDAVIQPQISVIQRRDLSKLYIDIYSPRTESSYTVGDIIEIDVSTSRVQNGKASLHFFYTDATNLTPKCWDGKISNFEVESLESTFKISLVPCKLLKPVPKWLDANGIRRQVGECGMIDIISGKFYGNVNSVGTFTVENYYERKEWLQGRNGAYINTEYELTPFDDAFYIKAKYDGSTKNPDNDEQYVFGMRNYVSSTNRYYCVTLINALNKIAPRYCNLGSDNPATDEATNFEVFLSADTNYMYRTLNGVAYPAYSHDGTFVLKSDKTIYLFKANFTDSPQEAVNKYFHGDIASFRISDPTFTTDKMNLIPCTLTMDLPASMDANNIARTKGTSGMWDLVSDRFYGNVASSGTFKAVNLAEGVDYEVHQWLKGDGSTYIDTNIIVNSSTLVLSIKSKASSSNGMLCGSRNGANLNSDTTAILYEGGRYRLDILSESPNYVRVNKGNLEDSFDIDLASNTAVVNGTTLTSSKNHTNSINTFRVFGCFGSNTGYSGYINKFMLNDGYNNLNLIPVKLLRSIPSKYDANGIARQAGECGMYDTVNDVFYGNVASSGSFSVSDDN